MALAPHTDCCLVVWDRNWWLKQSLLLSLANHPGAGHICPVEENGFQNLCVWIRLAAALPGMWLQPGISWQVEEGQLAEDHGVLWVSDASRAEEPEDRFTLLFIISLVLAPTVLNRIWLLESFTWKRHLPTLGLQTIWNFVSVCVIPFSLSPIHDQQAL